MIKFNMKKIVSLCLASTLALSMTACSGKIEIEEECSESYSVISIEEIANSLAEAAIEKNENNENNNKDENVALAIEFDESFPAVVNIEKVEMEDGVVGYKYPLYYVPYLVDKTKSMPGISSVLDFSDGYEIVSECSVINKEGKKEVRNFDGCVAVYYPYYYALCLKEADATLFEEKKEAALATYGENSIQYRIFTSVDDLPELIISTYNENKALSIK